MPIKQDKIIQKAYKLNLAEFSEQKIRQVYNKGKEGLLMDYCKKVLKEKFPNENPVLITRAGNKIAKELYEKYIKPTVIVKPQRL